MNLPPPPREPLSRQEVPRIHGMIPHSQEELPLINSSEIGVDPPIMAITRQEIIIHIPMTNMMDQATNVMLFQFPPLRPGYGPLLPPPRTEEYIPQYMNYQTHGYHDVSSPYTTKILPLKITLIAM